MKKILIFMLFLTALSFSKNKGIDFKVGASVNHSRYREKSRYYNNPTPDSQNGLPLIKEYKNRKGVSFDIYFKVLKEDDILKDKNLELKYGGGLSLDIIRRSKLNSGFKNVEKYNGDTQPAYPTTDQEGEFPDDCSTFVNKSRCLLHDYLEHLVKENEKDINNTDHYKSESDAGTIKMYEISKEKTRAYLSMFGSVELARKIYKDLKVYGGVDAGLSVLLATQEESSFYYGSKNYRSHFKLTRNQQKIAPKIKGILGLNYKYLDVEFAIGYPNAVSFGIGTRIGI